jgi:DNA-directed RNA polymerase III subunit RPC1
MWYEPTSNHASSRVPLPAAAAAAACLPACLPSQIGYFKNTVQLLQCICKTCSRVLLPEEERRKWLK